MTLTNDLFQVMKVRDFVMWNRWSEASRPWGAKSRPPIFQKGGLEGFKARKSPGIPLFEKGDAPNNARNLLIPAGKSGFSVVRPGKFAFARILMEGKLHFGGQFGPNRKKGLTSPADQCDKRFMFTRLRQAVAQTKEGRKVLVAVRDRLLDVNLSLVLVLIILVLIAQSGEGLAA